MLKGKLIHPEIIAALSLCGHGDKILIADGNYPLEARTGDADLVYVGVSPGLPAVTDVLAALQSVCNFEKAEVMQPEDGSAPAVFEEFAAMLPELKLEPLERYAFYDACCEPAVRLAISTGEKRTYANLLLTVGVA